MKSKKSIVLEAARANGTKINEATSLTNTFIGLVAAALKDGESVRIDGLGTFHIVERKEHAARNPKTGEAIVVPTRKVIKFVACQDLKNL